ARLSSLCLVFLCETIQNANLNLYKTKSFTELPEQICGEDILISCVSFSYGAWKIFCRETCEGGNLLIRTSDDAAQIGRYRTEYVRQASKTFSVLSVTITQLTQSDSGRYRCKLDRAIRSDLDRDFSITVTDAVGPSSSTPAVTSQTFSSISAHVFTNNPTSLTTTTQRFNSSSGSEHAQCEPACCPSADVPVIVGVTLAAMVVLVSAALLVSCRRRSLRGETPTNTSTQLKEP
uniref:Immunoglobulin subtype domain-containing protein n=1 Tax=Poecilia formosa TaxID=48698 RepID=A0A087XAL3_POEFO